MRRRDLVIAVGAAIATPAVVRAATNESDETIVDYLFVQLCDSVDLSKGELRLGGVNPSTLYFSDRPERIVGRTTTKAFVEHWGTGADNFKSDPPNAVLTLHDHDTSIEIAVELTSPRFDGDALVYAVMVLEGDTAVTSGAASLFIDLIGRPLTPLSFAGAARRTRRRRFLY